jgi:hypothetical protein
MFSCKNELAFIGMLVQLVDTPVETCVLKVWSKGELGEWHPHVYEIGTVTVPVRVPFYMKY